jgi:hypothetical protein
MKSKHSSTGSHHNPICTRSSSPGTTTFSLTKHVTRNSSHARKTAPRRGRTSTGAESSIYKMNQSHYQYQLPTLKLKQPTLNIHPNNPEPSKSTDPLKHQNAAHSHSNTPPSAISGRIKSPPTPTCCSSTVPRLYTGTVMVKLKVKVGESR